MYSDTFSLLLPFFAAISFLFFEIKKFFGIFVDKELHNSVTSDIKNIHCYIFLVYI